MNVQVGRVWASFMAMGMVTQTVNAGESWLISNNKPGLFLHIPLLGMIKNGWLMVRFIIAD